MRVPPSVLQVHANLDVPRKTGYESFACHYSRIELVSECSLVALDMSRKTSLEVAFVVWRKAGIWVPALTNVEDTECLKALEAL